MPSKSNNLQHWLKSDHITFVLGYMCAWIAFGYATFFLFQDKIMFSITFMVVIFLSAALGFDLGESTKGHGLKEL